MAIFWFTSLKLAHYVQPHIFRHSAVPVDTKGFRGSLFLFYHHFLVRCPMNEIFYSFNFSFDLFFLMLIFRQTSFQFCIPHLKTQQPVMPWSGAPEGMWTRGRTMGQSGKFCKETSLHCQCYQFEIKWFKCIHVGLLKSIRPQKVTMHW